MDIFEELEVVKFYILFNLIFLCTELLILLTLSSVGLSSTNLSLITTDRQGDNLCALSWAMMKFLKPASRVRNHAINMINCRICADMLCYGLPLT